MSLSSDGAASRPPGSRPRRTMIIAAVAVIVVAIISVGFGVLTFNQSRPLPQATPTLSLLGETVPMGPATHVTAASALEITPGQPPAGGPHFAAPLRAGIATAPVEDGNAIHSLEHGMIWISYRADLIAAPDLDTLRAVAQAHPNDVLLTPRPQNAGPASVVSWGRRLALASPIARQTVEDFIKTNLNNSPEPGVR